MQLCTFFYLNFNPILSFTSFSELNLEYDDYKAACDDLFPTSPPSITVNSTSQ